MSFEFAVPHDGTQAEIPPDEQLIVGIAFSSYVDDQLLGSIEQVTAGQDSGTRLTLSSRGPRRQGIRVHIIESPNGRSYTKLIHVLDVDATGRDGDASDYRLGEDGIVRRTDLPKQTDHQKAMQARLGLGALSADSSFSLEEIVAKAKEAKAKIIADLPNKQLQEDLGMRNQPVGFAEFESLRALIDTCAVSL